MAIFEITTAALRPLDETTFANEGLRERGDLQRLLRERIEVIAPDTMVLTEEFCDWEDSWRRIDLLGLDRDANLVIIELKRTEDGGHMELQALRYAAMVSAMTFDKVVEVHTRYLSRVGRDTDARAAVLGFLGWDEPKEDLFAQDVRIVLASAEFSKEVTTTGPLAQRAWARHPLRPSEALSARWPHPRGRPAHHPPPRGGRVPGPDPAEGGAWAARPRPGSSSVGRTVLHGGHRGGQWCDRPGCGQGDPRLDHPARHDRRVGQG